MLRRMFLVLALGLVCATGCGEPHWVEAASDAAVSSEVSDWNVGRKVLVFTTPDCAVCQRDKPLVHELRLKCVPEGVGVVEIDAYQHPEMAKQFGVKRYPTYVLCEDGEVKGVALSFKLMLKLLKVIFFIAMFFI